MVLNLATSQSRPWNTWKDYASALVSPSAVLYVLPLVQWKVFEDVSMLGYKLELSLIATLFFFSFTPLPIPCSCFDFLTFRLPQVHLTSCDNTKYTPGTVRKSTLPLFIMDTILSGGQDLRWFTWYEEGLEMCPMFEKRHVCWMLDWSSG